MAGILDFLTGGEDQNAANALSGAMQNYQAINAPTAQQLTLPQLQQYVNAGMMTPAQATAYLQQSNAFATENTPQTGTAAQIAALNQLSGIANAGAAGTPTEQAQQAQTIQQMNEAVGGQRGAAEQAAQARGTPGALVSQALAGQQQGQDAQQAYQNALQSQGQAYQTALNAMSQGAGVGNALQGQQNQQANTVAQAQNAMQQFNAQNQQQNSQFNAGLQQGANAYNTQNAQNVANQNTGLANQRTEYNAQVPETVFNNQMQKAGGQAGVAGQQANQAMQAGQQQAGLISGLVGAGATLGGDYFMGQGLGNLAGAGMNQVAGGTQAGSGYQFGPPAGANTGQYAPGMAQGGMITGHEGCYHDGGLCMKQGGMVPGKAPVPGDSVKNDIVTAHVSPGEAVIPRSQVQQHLPQVLGLLSGHPQSPQPPVQPHHPQDVASLLLAMKKLRGAA